MNEENWIDMFINKFNESKDYKITDVRDRERLLDELRPKGQWLFNGNEWECSRCKNAPWYNKSPMESNYDFCPYCSADMRGDK